jgi:hypothetical protein
MTRDEVIALAREAGLGKTTNYEREMVWKLENIEAHGRFAALVAAAERERCAKVCETGVDTEHPTVKGHIMKNFGASPHLAAAIRKGE